MAWILARHLALEAQGRRHRGPDVGGRPRMAAFAEKCCVFVHFSYTLPKHNAVVLIFPGFLKFPRKVPEARRCAPLGSLFL